MSVHSPPYGDVGWTLNTINTMSKYTKILLVVLGLLVVVTAVKVWLPQKQAPQAILGATTDNNPATGLDNANLWGALQIGSTAFSQIPGTTVSTGWSLSGAGASCASTASSTLFSVANPFTGSSTATVMINVTGQATTSVLTVGTTTASTGLTTTNTSATLMNASVSTTTAAQFLSGLTGAGAQTSAGANTFLTIAVGPNERVGATATSTATGAGAAGYNPGFSSCTYKVLFAQ